MGLDIKIGVSTWLWTSPFKTTSIPELFPKIAGMGFDAVEIAVEDPSLIDAKKVAIALSEYGLDVVICGAFGPTRDLTSESAQVHQIAFDYIEACLDMCAELGVEFLGG